MAVRSAAKSALVLWATLTGNDEVKALPYDDGRRFVVNGDDVRRLGSELPIVRALAVKAIEEAFGVDTRDMNYRKHLYELHGFKKILGPDVV
jgi:hypothetical protein